MRAAAGPGPLRLGVLGSVSPIYSPIASPVKTNADTRYVIQIAHPCSGRVPSHAAQHTTAMAVIVRKPVTTPNTKIHCTARPPTRYRWPTRVPHPTANPIQYKSLALPPKHLGVFSAFVRAGDLPHRLHQIEHLSRDVKREGAALGGVAAFHPLQPNGRRQVQNVEHHGNTGRLRSSDPALAQRPGSQAHIEDRRDVALWELPCDGSCLLLATPNPLQRPGEVILPRTVRPEERRHPLINREDDSTGLVGKPARVGGLARPGGTGNQVPPAAGYITHARRPVHAFAQAS